MRLAIASLAALTLGLALTPSALARRPSARRQAAVAGAVRSLDRGLSLGMREAGRYSGALVVDLQTGQTLFSANARVGRLPASVEKLYTTTTALQRFGPNATLSTSLLGQGTMSQGTFTGTLYLRGGGDPTFGAAGFDRTNYGSGTGGTMQQLVSALIRATGMRALKGAVVADETMFDSDRGTPATNNQPSLEVEGELSALAYDRGWESAAGTLYYSHPAMQAGRQLIAALRTAGVRIPRTTRASAGVTPPTATLLAGEPSPPIATLIALTNTPSDNYFAETLLKDVGARFGTAGTTAAGATVVRAQMASDFGIHPRLNDGSGLSRYDLTSPTQVVSLLRGMAGDSPFIASLAVAGRTGTLKDEMRHTYAQGRCMGKTGTLTDASNLVGYCHARDGHTLAFALLMNRIYPYYAHPVQNGMVEAIAGYTG
ncbi:MAG: D-alanyl-D-alanine carboxypeptidase [Solirubrobacteraceae bacterium]